MIHNDLGLNPRDHNAVLARVRAQDPSITAASLYSGIKDGQITDSIAAASAQTKTASKTFQSSIVFSDLGNDEGKHEVKPVSDVCVHVSALFQGTKRCQSGTHF